MVTSPLDRRKTIRRISDNCTQCSIWTLKIADIEKKVENQQTAIGDAITTLNNRIDKNLPWRVFLLIVGLYLGLAAYNALAIKDLSIETGKLATKIDAINEKMIDVKQQLKRK